MTDSVAVKIKSKVRAPKYLLAIPAIIWYLVFFAAPIGFIVVYSFGTKDTSKLLPVDLSNLSSASYSSVFDETFFKVFRATLRISVIATAMCLFIGLPVAYFAAFKVAEKNPILIMKEQNDTTKEYNYRAELYIGGVDGKRIYYGKPIIYDDHREHFMFPNEARLKNLTYQSNIVF